MWSAARRESIGKSRAENKAVIKTASGQPPSGHLYTVLIHRNSISHRFFMLRHLIARSLQRIPALERSTLMLDIILIALGLGLFAMSIGYAYACDRL
jgi:hypothetical protein